jgi:hypothetical protein
VCRQKKNHRWFRLTAYAHGIDGSEKSERPTPVASPSIVPNGGSSQTIIGRNPAQIKETRFAAASWSGFPLFFDSIVPHSGHRSGVARRMGNCHAGRAEAIIKSVDTLQNFTLWALHEFDKLLRFRAGREKRLRARCSTDVEKWA